MVFQNHFFVFQDKHKAGVDYYLLVSRIIFSFSKKMISLYSRMITRLAQIISSHVRFFLMKMTMHRYMNNNKHALHIQHYVMNCSIGDWFVLYQMSKNMNKRFFAEFIALLSLKINPDPYLSADPEIDILKRSDDEEGPNGDSGVRI